MILLLLALGTSALVATLAAIWLLPAIILAALAAVSDEAA